MGLLSSNVPASTPPLNQLENRLERIEALNLTVAPEVCFDIVVVEDLPDRMVEAAEPVDDEETDEDETKKYIHGSDFATIAGPAGLHESSPNQAAPTPFRLLAFSNRGSPSA